MERSASYYVSWAAHISPDCKDYVSEIFNPQRTNQPEEVYYKLCASIMSLSRKYELSVLNKTCRQCIEHRVFTYRKFEATPTNHENMRGSSYFQ